MAETMTELAGRELDAAIARGLGAEVRDNWAESLITGDRWYEPLWHTPEMPEAGAYYWGFVPEFHRDLNTIPKYGEPFLRENDYHHNHHWELLGPSSYYDGYIVRLWDWGADSTEYEGCGDNAALAYWRAVRCLMKADEEVALDD